MDKLYTIQEVALKLNLSDKTLRRWEEAGRFTPTRTLGNQRRYTLEDLQILDALKHGTINEQKDLLTIKQAALLCGVSPTTVLRWENDGKIHPFITSGNTYYPRQKLIEKMDELKRFYVEPIPIPHTPGVSNPAHDLSDPLGSDLRGRAHPADTTAGRSDPKVAPHLSPILTNTLITLILILAYHLIFNSSPAKLNSPGGGSVQGTSTISDPTIDLLKRILDPSGALTTTILTSRNGLISPTLSLSPSSTPLSPTPGMVYYDAASQSLRVYKGTSWVELSPTNSFKVGEATLISASSTLPKGKNQVSVTQEKLTPLTPVTITFASDYAPAKKYWAIVDQGSFTLHTDFPVGSDATFNYSFLAPTSTPTSSATPSAMLR